MQWKSTETKRSFLGNEQAIPDPHDTSQRAI